MKAVAAFLLVLCYLAVSHAWSCTEGPRLYKAAQIDAGRGQVVARDIYNRAYYLLGTSWYRLGTGSIRHVSVGPSGIWGVDTSYRTNKFIAGNFRPASGVSMYQVDAGGDGQVVGVTRSSYYTYCLRDSYSAAFKGSGSLSWSYLSRTMKYYSCGPLYGCWGVDTSSRTFNTQRIYSNTCGTGSWTYVSGLTLKMIEVGTDGSVFGVATNGKVYQRSGISSSRPYGTSWSYISMCMPVSHVSYDLGQLWVVTTSGLIMKCTH